MSRQWQIIEIVRSKRDESFGVADADRSRDFELRLRRTNFDKNGHRDEESKSMHF